jgi:3-hydroxyacyl-[acyl-carrier-protein] dehydratase
MPSTPLIDFDALPLDKPVATREQVRRFLKQRGRFELLDGIAYANAGQNLVVAFIDVARDAWWVSDHIPGRPLFPGALMIEAAAQMCTYDFLQRQPELKDAFLGFAGVNEVRFRGTVEPGCRFYLAGRVERIRRTMFTYATQGFVDRKLVYEGEIMGMAV